MRNEVAYQIRRLHRKHAQVDRRLGLIDIVGKAKAGSQDMEKRTVRLVLGTTKDGKEILSPPIRWQGTAAGDFMMHAVPADNEQMVMHSPSGTVGNGTMAHWGTYDQDHQPPSKNKNEAMHKRGKASITFKDDKLVIKFGDKSGFEISEKELKMLGTFRAKNGENPAHYKGGVDTHGDKAVDGNPDMLV